MNLDSKLEQLEGYGSKIRSPQKYQNNNLTCTSTFACTIYVEMDVFVTIIGEELLLLLPAAAKTFALHPS